MVRERTAVGSAVRAACRLLWSDPAVGGDRPADAGYVHGPVIDRSAAGSGVGERVLELVAERVRGAGRPLLRLDCVEGNRRLRDYYCALCFRLVGRKEFTHRCDPVVLLERSLLETAPHAKNPGGR